jgi:Cytochrome P450
MLSLSAISTSSLIPGAVLFSVLYYITWIIYARFFHPYSDVPGPFFASISRLWLGASISNGDAEWTQRALHARLGPLVRIAPNEVSVSDPTAIKNIYNIKSGFTKTDFYPPFAPNISAHGDLFTQLDETKHAQRRKFVNNVYSMSTILESEKYIDGCTEIFMSKMEKFAKDGTTVDLGEWIQWCVPALFLP